MADVGQGKDRLTAIALTAGHGGNRAGRRDGGLGRVADAMGPNFVQLSAPNPAPDGPNRACRARAAGAAASAALSGSYMLPWMAGKGPRSLASSMLVRMVW